MASEPTAPFFSSHSGNLTEDIANVCALGFIVDDDNEPAPENIPAVRANNNRQATTERVWGWSGIDHGNRPMDSVVVHASIVFLGLRCKGL
jgi:hypothetical protein